MGAQRIDEGMGEKTTTTTTNTVEGVVWERIIIHHKHKEEDRGDGRRRIHEGMGEKTTTTTTTAVEWVVWGG